MASHPDKNPDPESKKLFVKIANAYEVKKSILVQFCLFFSYFFLLIFNCFWKMQILKDEATREQYDYAIAHPEEVHFSSFFLF